MSILNNPLGVLMLLEKYTKLNKTKFNAEFMLSRSAYIFYVCITYDSCKVMRPI